MVAKDSPTQDRPSLPPFGLAEMPPSAGAIEVAAHSSKHHHHPMNLFAVLSTLDTVCQKAPNLPHAF